MFAKLARDKHFNFCRKCVNYGRKKFYDIGPECVDFREREPRRPRQPPPGNGQHGLEDSHAPTVQGQRRSAGPSRRRQLLQLRLRDLGCRRFERRGRTTFFSIEQHVLDTNAGKQLSGAATDV